MSRPKHMKGIYGAKTDVRRSLSRLRSQLEAMEEIFSEGGELAAREMAPSAHAAIQDLGHIIEAIGRWEALYHVVDDTYLDPKLEVGVEDPLVFAVADLVNQSTMPGASIPRGYRKRWKKVYDLLRGEKYGN